MEELLSATGMDYLWPALLSLPVSYLLRSCGGVPFMNHESGTKNNSLGDLASKDLRTRSPYDCFYFVIVMVINVSCIIAVDLTT